MCLPFDPKRVDEFDPIGAPKLDDVILGANGNAKGNSSKHPSCTTHSLSLSLSHPHTHTCGSHSFRCARVSFDEGVTQGL